MKKEQQSKLAMLLEALSRAERQLTIFEDALHCSRTKAHLTCLRAIAKAKEKQT